MPKLYSRRHTKRIFQQASSYKHITNEGLRALQDLAQCLVMELSSRAANKCRGRRVDKVHIKEAINDKLPEKLINYIENSGQNGKSEITPIYTRKVSPKKPKFDKIPVAFSKRRGGGYL